MLFSLLELVSREIILKIVDFDLGVLIMNWDIILLLFQNRSGLALRPASDDPRDLLLDHLPLWQIC